MNISNSIEISLEKKLQESRRPIFEELSKIFSEEYKYSLIDTLNCTVVRYITTEETINNLLNNRNLLEKNTIKILEYYKSEINKNTIKDDEISIGRYDHSYNRKLVSPDKEEEFNKIQEILNNNEDKGTILKINEKYYSYPKIDIFNINSNEDYIFELITLFTVKNNPNLYNELLSKYGKEFTDKYMYFRNITANVISKIVARNLSQKNIHLFSQNKNFNYWMDREEILKYTFNENLGPILEKPIEFIDKVGEDNLTKFIDNLKTIIETNSAEEINKKEFKNLLDRIRNNCYQKISINESLINEQLKKLRTNKEKLNNIKAKESDQASFQDLLDNKGKIR